MISYSAIASESACVDSLFFSSSSLHSLSTANPDPQERLIALLQLMITQKLVESSTIKQIAEAARLNSYAELRKLLPTHLSPEALAFVKVYEKLIYELK